MIVKTHAFHNSTGWFEGKSTGSHQEGHCGPFNDGARNGKDPCIFTIFHCAPRGTKAYITYNVMIIISILYIQLYIYNYVCICIYKHSHQPLFLLRCRPSLSRLNEIGNIETNLDPKRKSLNSSNGAQHSTSGQTQEKECPPCPLGPSPHRGNPKHATLDPFKIAKINPPPGIFLLGFRI